MSRILITGGAGFIGRHLVERLAENGHWLRCLVRRPEGCGAELQQHAELVRGDLESPATLAAATQDIDVVYHLAGRTAAAQVREMYAVNGRGTAALLAACARQTTPPVVIHVSSLAAVGPSPAGAPRHEADHAAPVSHYGQSKLAGERAVRAWAAHLPATIVRPGIVFGPRDRATLPLFQSLAWAGIHAMPGLRLKQYAFIHIHDLVELLVRAAERGTRISPTGELSPGGCYFAVAREQPHGLELAHLLAHAVGRRKYLPLFVPEPVAWILGAVNEAVARISKQAPALGLDKVREATAGDWTASTLAVERELDFTPPLSLGGRFDETADWYRAAGWLDWRRTKAVAAIERAEDLCEVVSTPSWEGKRNISAT